MVRLSTEIAQNIINLNPGNVIDADIANRQFEVIVKGFNYLNQKDNKYLYIADEVGLGKTYIALGIASLLRYFAPDDLLQSYQDLIIVPKKNLQFKWQKEIKNFVDHNFTIESNRVKSILGKPVALNRDDQLHDYLERFDSSYPSYEIFRNSSFSLGFSGEGWKQKLLSRLDEYGQSIMHQAFKHYKVKEIYTSEETYPEIKRLFGYLMNISMQSVDLIIVDEAHNFKHGVGQHVAYRNQVMSRIMGVIDDNGDEDLFSLFPDLKDKIKPKANKVIFLSATPMDNGCHEIKNLLDVFIANHPYIGLSNAEADEIIKNELSQFMMRGLMKITLRDKSYSRNQYRYEHRLGNVNKDEIPKIQKIDDPFMSATIGLIQLKTAEVLNTKNHGGAFEMGMNASFETFRINKENENDVDEGNQSNNKKGADEDIVYKIVNSYKETFKSELPHPKQERLIKQLFEKMKRSEKSLVFVRRIASVNEITRKLVNLYEEYIFSRIKSIDCKSSDIDVLITKFEDRSSQAQFYDYLDNVAKRIYWNHRDDIVFNEDPEDNNEAIGILYSKLKTIFDLKLGDPNVLELYELIKSKMHLSSVSTEIRLKALPILKDNFDLKVDTVEAEESEAGHRYFFLDYFTKAYPKGLAFKSLISKQNWYRYNYFYLFKRLGYGTRINANLDVQLVTDSIADSNLSDEINQLLLDSFEKKGSLDRIHPSFQDKTFFTKLLEEVFANEWSSWLSNEKRKDLPLDQLLEDLESLVEILRGVFRNGSGLLPSYIAYYERGDNKFEDHFISLLQNHFPDVLEEVRTIIIDFDKLIASNFPDRSKIARSMYQQAPVLPASGHHTRGVSGIALQFRMPGFPYVVITTDVLKEGEDLHTYCNDIYHYGIAWNPSDMEQRTGRIDRINSKTYYALKSKKEINFENALHVFYPYLSDTLEVNQMAKLFSKMNQFVQTFYDVTATIEKESKVSVDDQIYLIPEQNKELLESKFDCDKFSTTIDKEFNDITLPNHFGQNSDNLKVVLQGLLPVLGLVPHFQFGVYNESRFAIKGILKVDSDLGVRKGPYSIMVIPNQQNVGIYDLMISSRICNANDVRSQLKRTEMAACLSNQNHTLQIEGNFLSAAQILPLDSRPDFIIECLMNVAMAADKLEMQYTGKDED